MLFALSHITIVLREFFDRGGGVNIFPTAE